MAIADEALRNVRRESHGEGGMGADVVIVELLELVLDVG
jgi:hypothetical protein